MAFTILLLSVLVLVAVLAPRFGSDSREYGNLSWPAEWPRLPELPPSDYGVSTTSVSAPALPRPRADVERTQRDLVS